MYSSSVGKAYKTYKAYKTRYTPAKTQNTPENQSHYEDVHPILPQPHKRDSCHMSTFLFSHAPPPLLVISSYHYGRAHRVSLVCPFSLPPSPFSLQECGVALEDFDAFKEGDVVQCYSLEEIKRTL